MTGAVNLPPNVTEPTNSSPNVIEPWFCHVWWPPNRDRATKRDERHAKHAGARQTRGWSPPNSLEQARETGQRLMKSWELRRWAMLVGIRFGSTTIVVALDRFVVALDTFVGRWSRLFRARDV